MNRDDKKRQTRDVILNTAGRLFQEESFAKVSTRLIAKESGVGVGTVFSHFKSKQALTIALFHEKIDLRLMAHLEIAEQEESGLNYFLSFAQFLYEFYEEDREFSIALLQNALFDIQFFQQQMDAFTVQVASKLQSELPKHNDLQRINMAKAWFGFYIFHLLSGLGQVQLTSQDWLSGLKQDCKVMLSSFET